ncbi:glycosyltransferase [Podospora australis]|uniref:N-acetylgalactosaminide beta-1,3-galactosyltransferase n=1 Tax=Podospora australis TaxID=1536484 RepID=A0AAN7AJN2_9PEZI|nr:glycosyltransferase [Podospora australis]
MSQVSWDRIGQGPRQPPRSTSYLLLLRPKRSWRRFLPKLRSIITFCLCLFFFAWLILPYDNVVRLAVRWNLHRLHHAWTTRPAESWVFAARPEFPVDLGEDTLVVLKTGYGTRDRVPAWLEALSPGNELKDVLVIADYSYSATKPDNKESFSWKGRSLPVYDMVERALGHENLRGYYQEHPRVKKYEDLKEAVEKGEEERAKKLSKRFGWELDALKFMSGLEFAYDRFPRKKWYLLVDDDTFLVQPSLKPFLGHLDPEQTHYLGNAVGDFKARFAHGGSAIILSQATMQSLIVDNGDALKTSYLDSLDEVWGDRLLAKALIRLGIYLDESYCHLFNGEPPRYSKIRTDRICSPVLSFHTLPSPDKMRQVGEHFRNVSKPVFWLDLWDIYGVTPPWRQADETATKEWDYVGEPDEQVLTIKKIATASDCMAHCEKRSRGCLAWTWEAETMDCHISPWMIVGDKAGGKVSGINLSRARHLETNCLLY